MKIEAESVNSGAAVTPHNGLEALPASNSISLSAIRPRTWFVCDYAIAYASASVAFFISPYTLQISSGLTTGEHVKQLPFSLGLALIVALVAHIVGLHERGQRTRSFALLGRCATVAGIALLLMNAELLLVHYQTVGRWITLVTFVGVTLGLFILRALIVGLASRNELKVAFAGSKSFTDRAIGFAASDPARGFQSFPLELTVGQSFDLKSWAMRNGIHQFVVDTNDPDAPSESELMHLINSGFAVSTYANFVESQFERVPSEHINTQWVIDCQANHAMLYKRSIKRGLDIVVAALALLLLSPLVLIAALCIWADSRGPVVFRQVRVGQYGKPFTMLKLRTMKADAESNGAQWASSGDNRVTGVGRFLRASRLDEAPQLLNVLAGNMSLVGPRPERPEFTATLESNIPYFVNRLLVKPGITGWAQINAGYAASEEDSANKLSFDLYYVKTLSFGMDLRILLRTISSFANGSR